MIEKIYKKIFPRKADSHKGSYGHILVIAGSASCTGSAYLASQAALVAGSGLVTLGVPASLHSILAKKLVEVMVKPLPETRAQTISLDAAGEIINFSKKADVVAIGPGLSQNSKTQRLVRDLIKKIARPFVADADALNALAGHCSILKRLRHPIVLTPHPGEMSYIIGKDTAFIQKKRKEVARAFAREYNVVLVLKGHRTVVAEPGGKIYINKTGNPGMATGGAGDVLTGVIASFMGQGLDPYEASCLGVYVHGLAGDLVSREKGQLSLIATDLLNKIPKALKALS